MIVCRVITYFNARCGRYTQKSSLQAYIHWNILKAQPVYVASQSPWCPKGIFWVSVTLWLHCEVTVTDFSVVCTSSQKGISTLHCHGYDFFSKSRDGNASNESCILVTMLSYIGDILIRVLLGYIWYIYI